jgi:hypothetical protein
MKKHSYLYYYYDFFFVNSLPSFTSLLDVSSSLFFYLLEYFFDKKKKTTTFQQSKLHWIERECVGTLLKERLWSKIKVIASDLKSISYEKKKHLQVNQC